jgi:hypothetical protein
VQARVFGPLDDFAMGAGHIDRHAGRDLRRDEAATDQALEPRDAARLRREYDPEFALGAFELLFAKNAYHQGRQRYGTFARA